MKVLYMLQNHLDFDDLHNIKAITLADFCDSGLERFRASIAYSFNLVPPCVPLFTKTSEALSGVIVL